MCEKIAQAKGDNEAAVWFWEFQLKAVIFLGKWSRELEKAERARTDLHPNDGKQTKTQALAEVGLLTSTAQRYEELVGPKEKQAEAAVSAAQEHYFTEQREKGEPATFKGLKAIDQVFTRDTFASGDRIQDAC